MENKLENINIDKNKALFEYEMTEVILSLKGKYAAFSGKNTDFAKTMVEDEKLHLHIPEATQINAKETFDKTAGFAFQLPALPRFSNGGREEEKPAFKEEKINLWQKIALPVLPSFGKISAAAVSAEKAPDITKAALPSVKLPQLTSVSESSREIKGLSFKNAVLVDLPKMNFPAAVISGELRAPLEMQVINIPNIKKPFVNCNIKIDLSEKKAISVPTLPAFNTKESAATLKFEPLEKSAFQAKIPSRINVGNIPSISPVTLSAFELPEVSLKNLQNISMPDICVSNTNPTADILNNIEKTASEIKSATVRVSAMPQREHIAPSLKNIPAVNIKIPAVNIEISSAAKLHFSESHEVLQSVNQIHISKIKPIEIPTNVTAARHIAFAAPQKPDVTNFVNNIIALTAAVR